MNENSPAAMAGGSTPESLSGKKVRRAIFPLLDKSFQVKVTLFFLTLILLSHLFLLAIHYRNWNRTTSGALGKTGVELHEFVKHQNTIFVRDLILGVSCIGIMVALVVFYLTQRVSGPLFSIARVMEAFANGDLTARAALRKGDELQWFADRVNQSLDQIAKK